MIGLIIIYYFDDNVDELHHSINIVDELYLVYTLLHSTFVTFASVWYGSWVLHVSNELDASETSL